MPIVNNSFYRVIYLLIAIFLLSFFSYYSKDFKLDASSDTLILQNDNDFKYSMSKFNSSERVKKFSLDRVFNQIDQVYTKLLNE